MHTFGKKLKTTLLLNTNYSGLSHGVAVTVSVKENNNRQIDTMYYLLESLWLKSQIRSKSTD